MLGDLAELDEGLDAFHYRGGDMSISRLDITETIAAIRFAGFVHSNRPGKLEAARPIAGAINRIESDL